MSDTSLSPTSSISSSVGTAPPFPSTVPTAPLLRISLSKLLAHDPTEEQRFWGACCDLGFFYLDLRNPDDAETGVDGDGLLRDADALFEVAEDVFGLPVEEKTRYDFAEKGSYFGYKGYGAGVIDQAGTKDRNEFYNVSKDDILDIGPTLPAPACLTTQRPLLKSYITRSHLLVTYLLSLLEPHLGLPSNALRSLHKLDAVSGDQIRFVRAPPQPPEDRRTALGEHTDFGSVTVLFNRIGGLQVRLPDSVRPVPPEGEGEIGEVESRLCKEGWCYVRPLPGHAIINLGDAMVKFSAGILRSNLHRVVAPPGKQAEVVRYSLVYFARPEDEVLLKSLKDQSDVVRKAAEKEGAQEEEAITSKEWIIRRALGRRAGMEKKFEYVQGTERARGETG